MGEGRELMQKFRAECRSQADCCEADSPIELALREVVTALGAALATQPDPVPELPPYVRPHSAGSGWIVALCDGSQAWIGDDRTTPDDLDRIAEAARILAARERARRAGR